MASSAGPPQIAFDRFRAYLRLLAELHVGRRASVDFDASDVVQQTLLDACRDRDRFRGEADAEVAAWLRRLLACNIADIGRAARRAKRDAARVRSIEQALDDTSARLDSLLVADQTSPSRRAERHEAVLRLAEALEQLPPANRQALILRHCQGLGLAAIALRLDRTPAAVAGLLKRGLKQIRTLLPEDEP